MKLWLFVALLLAHPAYANHPWGGLDLCEARRDSVPPGIDAALLPQPTSAGAALLQKYCAQCHNLPGPGRHTREEWPAVVSRMETLMQVSHFYRGLLGPVAVPDTDERALLQGYLQHNALRALPPHPVALPMGQAERAFRTHCGDCHAAPDPRQYAAANWPSLLQRMDEHRAVMARPPLTPAQRVAIDEFIGSSTNGPTLTGSGHSGTLLPLPATTGTELDKTHNFGRWFVLAFFFGLSALALWRWPRGGR